MITWEDFEKLDMRTGPIVEAKPFERAKKPAYKLKIDFGKNGIKNSKLAIIPRAGHLPNLEQGEKYNAVLLEFLKSLD